MTSRKRQNDLRLILGRDSDNNITFTTLYKNPNMLVYGCDDMDQSQVLHSFILSILRESERCLLFLVDLKGYVFDLYKDIDVVEYSDNIDVATSNILWLVNEMRARYNYMSDNNIEDISKTGLTRIVCVIDDYADLVAKDKTVESHIISLIQNSRECGIHFIIGTQYRKSMILPELVRTVISAKVCLKVNKSKHFKNSFGIHGGEDLSGQCKLLFTGRGLDEPIMLEIPIITEEEKRKVAREAETYFKGKGLPKGMIPAAVPKVQSAAKKRKRVGFFQGLKNIINSPGNMTTDEFVALHYMNKK